MADFLQQVKELNNECKTLQRKSKEVFPDGTRIFYLEAEIYRCVFVVITDEYLIVTGYILSLLFCYLCFFIVCLTIPISLNKC